MSAQNNMSAYTHYKNFFQELAAQGLQHVVVSPGGRSAPLAICADANPNFKIWIQHDERTAGFFALGLAKQTQMPVALICTSGTATANYLPAVIEAYQSCVPLLVLTADRPANFRGKGFEQTIFQRGIYGKHIYWSYEMPLIGSNKNGSQPKRVQFKKSQKLAWHNKLAKKIFIKALGAAEIKKVSKGRMDGKRVHEVKKDAKRVAMVKKHRGGPIHINCPIAEPLEPKNLAEFKGHSIAEDDTEMSQAGNELSAGENELFVAENKVSVEGTGALSSGNEIAPNETLNRKFFYKKRINRQTNKLAKAITKNARGLILVGPQEYNDKIIAELLKLSMISGWPLLADAGSRFRFFNAPDLQNSKEKLSAESENIISGNIISTGHLLFASGFYKKHLPDVVLRVGPVPTNKLLRTEIVAKAPKRFFWCDPMQQKFCADFPTSNRLTHPDLGELFSRVVKKSQHKLSQHALSQSKVSQTSKTQNDKGSPHQNSDWTTLWMTADQKARKVIAQEFEKKRNKTKNKTVRNKTEPMTEPEVSYHLSQNLPTNTHILLANSFAIRDFDTFAQPQFRNIYPMTNRGANGIDGLIATALGISAGLNMDSDFNIFTAISQKTSTNKNKSTSKNVFLLAGDTAVLHDLSSLFSAKRLGLTLTLIILNNNGGAIFESLGLAHIFEASNSKSNQTSNSKSNPFERLFIAPTELKDFQFLNELPGVSAKKLKTPAQLKTFIQSPKTEPGIYIGEFITCRSKSMEMRRKINHLLKKAL